MGPSHSTLSMISVGWIGLNSSSVSFNCHGTRLRSGARHVLVGGRVVVEDGVLVGADLGEIRAQARTQAAALWRRMEAL